jgi:hypothetical protein
VKGDENCRRSGYTNRPGTANVSRARIQLLDFFTWRRGSDSKTLSPLVSHIARKVIQQDSKQRQSRNAVSGKNPHTAAFAMGYGRLRTAYISRGITQGLIFHANLRGRKVVAREASHLPHTAARQVLMTRMLLQNRFRAIGKWP